MLALALAALLAGCEDYYTPPPSPTVSVSPAAGTDGIGPVEVSLDVLSSSGAISAGTQQFTSQVYNSTDTKVSWSIVDPVTGDDLPGGKEADGSAPYGSIDSTGLYTAPALPPAVATFVVTATARAFTTAQGQAQVQLTTPAPVLSSVTVETSGSNPTPVPAMVQGNSYTLVLNGQFLYSNSVVTISGGTAGKVIPPSGKTAPFLTLTVPVTVNTAGLTEVGITSPNSAPANPAQLVVEPYSPAASSSLAAIIESIGANSSGAPILANKVYVPQTSANTVAVVNGDTGAQLSNGGTPLDIAMPSGFAPTAAATDPQTNTVAIISATTDQLVLVDATKDTVAATYAIPISGTASFSDGVTCGVCGVVADASRDVAVLDTAAGYLTLNLATGAASSPIAAPAAENFAYDAITQHVYAPYFNSSGSGLNVINLATGAVQAYALPGDAGFTLGAELAAAAFDPTTSLGLLADAATGQYAAINFNAATASGSGITAPAAQFGITAACSDDWRSAQLEPSSHFGWFGDGGGDCIAVAALPTGALTGPAAAPATIRWAALGAGPDGVDWSSAIAPQSQSVFIGLNGTFYGLALRGDGKYLARVDLAGMLAAPAPASPADDNQVDASGVITYIPIQ
ncbi:MAG: hypothetical protein ACRD2E_04055 [Terriglobales bacterium]